MVNLQLVPLIQVVARSPHHWVYYPYDMMVASFLIEPYQALYFAKRLVVARQSSALEYTHMIVEQVA
jgi:hypothetical protein